MRVGVVGLGYVGLTLADAASNGGHEVIGVDIDLERVTKLQSERQYLVSSDYSVLSDCEIVVIAVPTPLDESRNPDLSALETAVDSLQKVLVKPCLVVNESTSYPGTLRSVIAPRLGPTHSYASAPERVDPGSKNWSLENTPRIVAGLTEEAGLKAKSFYQSICDEVHLVSSPEVAEAAKLFENTFRQVNIALVNEFAQIANALGISTFETLAAAGTKPFGYMPFTPSVGVGGHCIPVDPSYLSFAAERAGVEARFINLANEVNLAMPKFVVKRLSEVAGGSLAGKQIQIAGISYKADVSDTRESPALVLIDLLRKGGASVSWHDSVVGTWNTESSNPISSCDYGVIVTAHSGVDYGAWKNGGTMVIDVSTALNTGWPKFL